uniref:Uncharacterized protein n=1 Tax=Anopheles atroparvus TaxID=41427 RepID=A0A182IZG5_ANOAO
MANAIIGCATLVLLVSLATVSSVVAVPTSVLADSKAANVDVSVTDVFEVVLQRVQFLLQVGGQRGKFSIQIGQLAAQLRDDAFRRVEHVVASEYVQQAKIGHRNLQVADASIDTPTRFTFSLAARWMKLMHWVSAWAF